MSLPKKVKKDLPLISGKVGKERRQELLEQITDHGTFLPKGVLHADLDRGMLDFVRDNLKCVVDGKTIPCVDKIITTQSWAQFTETWKFQDLDKNVSLPFIITVRQPEVNYGKFQGGIANIPERRQFFYYSVPTWDGQRKGADVYQIPQPVPVDVTYTVKIFCNRMRELNELNKIVMQRFTSKQAYTNIKGHFMPIMLESVTDESAKEIEKRKYYIQSYKFTLNGLLIDEEEFVVKPAITRQVTLFEFETKRKNKKVDIVPENTNNIDLDLTFVSGNTQLSEVFRYDTDLNINSTDNVSSYSVSINNNYLGDNLNTIQINNGDTLVVSVVKIDNTKTSIIKTKSVLI